MITASGSRVHAGSLVLRARKTARSTRVEGGTWRNRGTCARARRRPDARHLRPAPAEANREDQPLMSHRPCPADSECVTCSHFGCCPECNDCWHTEYLNL